MSANCLASSLPMHLMVCRSSALSTQLTLTLATPSASFLSSSEMRLCRLGNCSIMVPITPSPGQLNLATKATLLANPMSQARLSRKYFTSAVRP
ncbi:hypothetical protein D3C75_1066240 [compost metagenome]